MRLRAASAAVTILLCGSCTGSAAPGSPTSPSTTIDVLPYLVGAASLWPRLGNHGQNQIVDDSRSEVCWVKYGNPRRFECWRWDDQFVYHAVDHGLDGDSNESYTFTDGRWLARFLPASASAALPWSMDVPQNQIVWFDSACHVVPAQSHVFPYRQRAWFEPQRDAGPDLG